MKKRLFPYLLILTFAITTFSWVDYYLPEKCVAIVTGSEVKRVDKDGPVGADNPADGPTHDVYYIYTRFDNGNVRVFRNEDTGFHWPLYFKFNSADVQARSQSHVSDMKKVVISSYGWRVNVLSMFPNVLDVKVAEENQSTVSIIRWIGITLWASLFGAMFFFMHRWLNKKKGAANA